ncbi:MAG: hypothetical protein ACTTKL_06095 [Treponema sp.]
MKRSLIILASALLIPLVSACKDDVSSSGSQTASENHAAEKLAASPEKSGRQGGSPSAQNKKTPSPLPKAETPAHAITGLIPTEGKMWTPAFRIIPKASAAHIASVQFNGMEGRKMGAAIAVFGTGCYYIDQGSGSIYIYDPKASDTVTFKDKDGAVLGTFVYDGSTLKKAGSGESENGELQVKIEGSFEAALVNQKKYDAVSGASAAVSTNKNSNVGVFVTEKANPQAEDWIPASASSRSFKKSKIRIRTQDGGDANMGMRGMFVKFDSSLTLSGIPIRAGKYLISVELNDEYGRSAVSNELPFNVYAQDTALSDVLNDKCANKLGLWDMEPWAISNFGSGNEVRVPANLHHWFGSHESGTYGELGYAVGNDQEPTQTLVVASDLKLINMKVLSSVNIVVKNGAKLNLQDSSIHGRITVENGGALQMNYDEYNRKYATGAQINGKLVLKDGAALDHSLIYSNSNYLANGTIARRNEDAVIEVTGNVRVRGKVYVRGDEAATGVSAKTGKLLTGQPAMIVKGGTVTVDSGAELGLYGGGRMAITEEGGAALILENGTVTGDGKLIAVGGRSERANGACAVSGAADTHNVLSVKEAYLQGGNTYKSGYQGGEPYQNVEIGDDTIGEANRGKALRILADDDQPAYWSDILSPPRTDETCRTSGKPKIKK